MFRARGGLYHGRGEERLRGWPGRVPNVRVFAFGNNQLNPSLSAAAWSEEPVQPLHDALWTSRHILQCIISMLKCVLFSQPHKWAKSRSVPIATKRSMALSWLLWLQMPQKPRSSIPSISCAATAKRFNCEIFEGKFICLKALNLHGTFREHERRPYCHECFYKLWNGLLYEPDINQMKIEKLIWL